MSKLEDLQPNASVRGILPDGMVTVVSVQWFGSEALELTYSLNKPADFTLAVTEFREGRSHGAFHLLESLQRGRNFSVTDVNWGANGACRAAEVNDGVGVFGGTVGMQFRQGMEREAKAIPSPGRAGQYRHLLRV